MTEDTTPATEPTADEAKSDLVTWKDSEGNKHTGARNGSGYKRHLAQEKLAAKASAADESVQKSEESADTTETPAVAADAATADAPTAGDPAAAQGGEPDTAPELTGDAQAAADTTEARQQSAPKPGRTRTYGKV
ncbi:hypothetical protein SEA_NYCEIRAE_15 [Gordonia phage Nyceirae]|uniref:Uncharacterized protein n=1 Tax=Gordonia phage Nyceirae TaxID=1887651 RepID=A0A1C9EHX4_9CAUD|nr:hypothetical protein BIZ68_gp15 [Gordonia phage Nyceirae]AON97378.1 hypothetical protein SEA_NYCEIRAE_15 [Gordonia phage Nyceirae]